MGEASGLVEPDPYAGARKLSEAVVGDSDLWVMETPLACDVGCTKEPEKTDPDIRLLPPACSFT